MSWEDHPDSSICRGSVVGGCVDRMGGGGGWMGGAGPEGVEQEDAPLPEKGVDPKEKKLGPDEANKLSVMRYGKKNLVVNCSPGSFDYYYCVRFISGNVSTKHFNT